MNESLTNEERDAAKAKFLKVSNDPTKTNEEKRDAMEKYHAIIFRPLTKEEEYVENWWAEYEWKRKCGELPEKPTP